MCSINVVGLEFVYHPPGYYQFLFSLSWFEISVGCHAIVIRRVFSVVFIPLALFLCFSFNK